ncbi:hypothetical protein [Paraclostridium sordellii]|uniref:hypothetical protein n=1 Tax=Paraclostridium sordellii TaxID=1505 RepID=UPI0005E2F18B|nr:hypothetical protein [Paeniclostridium sordellii]CEO06792.1 Uncharacterised protein [[Clostridium] sordellii] [Paeniclostridium sordellii]CEP86672.1 Uncharacterised protein [[Clostridium] sordellii] [Paeniclostridium sordellii]CEP99613.1 Uncharacterised protein [[Clostridium] sordellii] [Paeniclostridium sordellii]
MGHRIVSSIICFLLGVLNILIPMPIILSLAVIILSAYLIDIVLLATPIFLGLNILMPNLPIGFGSDIFILKILVAIALTGAGYYLHNILKSYGTKFFHWLFDYVKRSVTFRLFDNYIVRNS